MRRTRVSNLLNRARRCSVSVLRAAFLIVAIALLVSCGGGTSGTGLSTFNGQVKSVDGIPIAGATVTNTTTGDSTITDETGHFVLQSEVKQEQEEIEFLLESGRFRATFVITTDSDKSTQIALDLVVDPNSNFVDVVNFSLNVQMTGTCAKYFTNGELLQQSAMVPTGVMCTLSATLKGDGILRGNIPIALQYRPCTGRSGVWRTLETAVTGTGRKLGDAEIKFKYIDSHKYCRYRIVAPYQYGGYRPVAYALETLSEQAAQIEAGGVYDPLAPGASND